jgi:hypothetical protein
MVDTIPILIQVLKWEMGRESLGACDLSYEEEE